MSRWIYLIPVAAFGLIAVFLFRSLTAPSPQTIPSALINKPVPDRTLVALDAQTQGFGPADFRQGKVILVNVFSSTCIPCREEAPALDRLAKQPGIILYGFVWKDKAQSARAFLDEVGNPFTRIGFDGDGKAGLDWGVYGWPETYVVDGKGIIRFKYIGALSDDIIRNQVMPQIEKARLAAQ